ncbi:MAG: ATP-grasp domain-containing protein [Pseudomonadota bacterium]
MRNIIVFLDLDATGSTPAFLAAANALNLTPMLLSLTPWMYPQVPAANLIRMREMKEASVIATIDQLGREKVAGVYTPRSHWAELAARVARAIGRPHSDPDAIALCHDKLKMRQFLAQNGFTDVAFQAAHSVDEACTFARNLGGSAVLKATGTSGAHGVRLCRTLNEVREHADKLLRKSPGGLLVEEHIQGPLYGVEVTHGKAYGVRHCFVAEGLAPILLGAQAPATMPAEQTDALIAHVQKALALVGYTRGAANVQAVVRDNQPFLIEINPRAPAGTAPANIKAGLGVDIAEFCLRFATGTAEQIQPYQHNKPEHTAVVRSLPRIKGSVRTVSGVEAATAVPHVQEVCVIPALFGRRGPAFNLADRVAYVQSVAKTPQAANDSATASLGKLVQIPESYWHYRLRRWREKLMRRINPRQIR